MVVIMSNSQLHGPGLNPHQGGNLFLNVSFTCKPLPIHQ